VRYANRETVLMFPIVSFVLRLEAIAEGTENTEFSTRDHGALRIWSTTVAGTEWHRGHYDRSRVALPDGCYPGGMRE
jgi:hypothetical protein